MLSAIVSAISLFLVGVTLLPLIKSGRWWIRIWDFPRQQLSLLLALALAAQLVLWPDEPLGMALALATALCLLWHLRCIFPYTRLRRTQVKAAGRGSPPDQRIRLLISNVYQDNKHAHGLFRTIASFDPDVLLVVEADEWWNRRLSAYRHRYPHHVLHPLSNTYGMLLFSRLEIIEAEVLERVTQDIPSIRALIRLRSGKIIELHCMHPEPPQVGADVDERNAELLMVAKETVQSQYPVIVCGDMNDVAWSHTTKMFQRLSGLLDPRIGRGLFSTFDARRWYARWPLDHVFHDKRFLLNQLQLGSYIGSDHFPIFVELVYQPDAQELQEEPERADASDQREAAKTIREGKNAAREAEREPADEVVAVVSQPG
ncbi:MAG TPA: endonuclease/exonuclease/phosphatase family protein [Pedomonas sp.]|uniref:endonuclease/exonuclease/phosphatase family protein n=1 Tax=Pedomonas sp. TaxID=2976421 RepID=UPI002F40BB09